MPRNFCLGDLDLEFSLADLHRLLLSPVMALESLDAFCKRIPGAEAAWIRERRHGCMPLGNGHLGWACAFFRSGPQPVSYSGGPLPRAPKDKGPPWAPTAPHGTLLCGRYCLRNFQGSEVIFLFDCTSALAIAAGQATGHRFSPRRTRHSPKSACLHAPWTLRGGTISVCPCPLWNLWQMRLLT